MKKYFVILLSTVLVLSVALSWAAIRGYQTPEDITLIDLESLTRAEGRLRTVGCGSMSMHDWQPFCCPGMGECGPQANPCSSTVHGCN